MTGIDNGFNVAKFADTVVSDTVGIGVNRLVLGAHRHPHAPILLICTIKREPCPAERIRKGWDVIRILVIALTRLPRLFKEQHTLERKDIRTDQSLEHIQYTWMEQKPLVNWQLAV